MVTDKDPVIVDGDEGRLVLHPTPAVLDGYRVRRLDAARLEAAALRTRDLPAVTLDGVEVELLANIELPEEIEDASRFGATGIGLYRSEFLYIERSPELPTEEEHLELFRQMLGAMAPYRVVVRTFDLGGRKLAQEVMHIEEENPGLGLRGIRLTLARPDIFRTQLRALYRASVDGELGIMVPLVTTLDEVRRFREFCHSVQDELRRDGLAFRPDVKLGVMIEVPAAALIADRIAREVDFLSLGTNDLIQYALAVDRSNEHVAHLYQPLHPAVLGMLGMVVEAGRTTGVEVSICGEMAGNAEHTALLLGLGLRRLSMSPRAVPAVKARVRELRVSDLEEICRGCTSLSTSDEVAARLESLRPAAGV
jgi:phosphotransferase system enzyme I (PtsI)